MRSVLRGRHAVALAPWLVIAACRDSTRPDAGPDLDADSITVVAAGDIVCGTGTPSGAPCRHAATAGLVALADPDVVLALGDLQYEVGTLENFYQFYESTWGVFKAKTWPVAGNHEYDMAGASGYYDYFNGPGADSGRAGHRARGWYSTRLGPWRVLGLNSNCAAIGGCGSGSPQEQWLRAELARRNETCTLAMWHHAHFSSAARAPTNAMRAIWQALQEGGVDLILASHAHQYERFAPLTADGARNDSVGIPSFVVGTGGKDLHPFGTTVSGSLARNGTSFGVLKLTLRGAGFDWEFFPVEPEGFTDRGAARCR